MSPKSVNFTSTGMSSTSACGVCGQSTMLVIICGPSSSMTTAIECGSVPMSGRGR